MTPQELNLELQELVFLTMQGKLGEVNAALFEHYNVEEPILSTPLELATRLQGINIDHTSGGITDAERDRAVRDILHEVVQLKNGLNGEPSQDSPEQLMS